MGKDKGIKRAAREQRRFEAEGRAAAYATLSPQQKLARLDALGFRAQRERARLAKQIGSAS